MSPSFPGPPPSLSVAGAGSPGEGTAAAEFSYTCHRCNRCCRNRRIQVNPYEVMRLARNLSLSTCDVIDRHVDVHTMSLRRREDGTCVFLGPDGCTVHADRPLVCRLYPLGRIVRGPDETWVVLSPAENSAGVFTRGGSVSAYVRAQGAEPYLRAADAYHAVVEAALRAGRGGEGSHTPIEGRSLLDVDAAIRPSDDSGTDPDTDLAAHVSHLRRLFLGDDQRPAPS